MKYKIGDKIRLTQDYICNYKKGQIYTINDIDSGGSLVCDNKKLFFSPDSEAIELFMGSKDQKFLMELTEQYSKKSGDRYNSNKLRWRNFPLHLIEPLVEVGAKGEEKYPTYNYLKGLSVADTIDSLKRHLVKLDNPDVPDVDEESECHHLAHIAWNALVALHFIKTRPDLDDRYRGEDE